MPRILLVSLFILSSCTRTEIVEVRPFEIDIPDPVFRAWCLAAKDAEGNLSVDRDGDGAITDREAAQVEEIWLDNEGGDRVGEEVMPGVQSLAGIEYFTALRRLGVGNNSLTSLELSRNTQLVYLNCSDNKITSIQLSAGSLLETFNCSGNRIASLNLSGMPALKYLYCTRNSLTALDVSRCSALVELSCDRNALTTLDVSPCTALTDLSCAGNGLTSLTLPVGSSLVRLDCGTHEWNGVSRANALPKLDLAGQDKLTLLRVNANPLTALDISPCTSLRTLEAVACRLGELDITANGRLRMLFCNDNPDGMKIYVPPGFDSSRFLSWVVGTATTEPRQ